MQGRRGGRDVQQEEDGEFQPLFPLRFATGSVPAIEGIGRGSRAVRHRQRRVIPVREDNGGDVGRGNDGRRVDSI